MNIRAFLIAAAAAVSGCSATHGLAPTRVVSGFDGGAVVDIEPHGAACGGMVCPGLGAQWTATKPDRAIIKVVVFNEWTPITSSSFSIDGVVTDLGQPQGITTFSRAGDPMKVSAVSFGAPLSTARAIAGAKRAWVRIGTPSGYIESAIVDGQTESKALHALRRFLVAVDAEPTAKP